MMQSPVMRDASSLKPTVLRSGRAEFAWSRVVATIANRDLIIVSAFCLIELLLTFNLLSVLDF
jgi:hypothetical protein